MFNPQLLEILAFTDPVCTWCWGSEPVLRKLEIAYGANLKIRPVMGGLVRDVRTFYDHANDIGGDPEQTNASVARHWLEASERHGMPVRVDGFRLFGSRCVSTWPQNIAYKAVELAEPKLASRYLRRLREASAAEARETGLKEVLIELASEVGADLAAFLRHLEDGSAEKAFHDDLALNQQYGVRAFPGFLLRYGQRELMLRGYQRFESFRAVIDALCDRALPFQHPAKTRDAMIGFIRQAGSVAPIEIETVFDLSAEESRQIISTLKSDGLVNIVPAGNGCFLVPARSAPGCDAESGGCSL